MVIGLGIDIVDQIRIQKTIHRYGERFLQRVFTEQEIELCRRYRYQSERYAGKFAVKEAFVKAMGTGFGLITFKDVEVLNKKEGAPYIVTSDNAIKMVNQRGISHIHVSLSHAASIAVAVVVLES